MEGSPEKHLHILLPKETIGRAYGILMKIPVLLPKRALDSFIGSEERKTLSGIQKMKRLMVNTSGGEKLYVILQIQFQSPHPAI